MRITGGTLRGRVIRIPGGAVRPTQDRVRQALFSILGERIPACSFLDLFAGSGAVGLEAWSRGAQSVWWVEGDRRVLPCLRQNVADLCGAEGRVVGMNVRSFFQKGISGHALFDVIFGDPPYAKRASRTDLLELIEAHGILASQGIVVLEEGRNRGEELPVPPGWVMADDRCYGETRLVFFQPCSTRSAQGVVLPGA